MCGGAEDKLGCYTLTPDGIWQKTHTLIKERFRHVSWQMEDGVLLIGGTGNAENTELGELKLVILRHHPVVFSEI